MLMAMAFNSGLACEAKHKVKIYIAHASCFDYQNELYKPLKASSLAEKHTLIFPHEADENPTHSKAIIGACDAIIAEGSHPSTGMGIELGWADDLGKPIIVIHKRDRQPSPSISIIASAVMPYSNINALNVEPLLHSESAAS